MIWLYFAIGFAGGFAVKGLIDSLRVIRGRMIINTTDVDKDVFKIEFNENPYELIKYKHILIDIVNESQEDHAI